MAAALQTIGRGLFQPACAAAGPSRTITRRSIMNSAGSAQRQVLGRITPKRIAVRLPPGSGGGEIPKRSVLTPTLFCLALGGGGYLFAAAYTNEDTRRWSERLGAGSWWRKGKSQPTDREIARAKTLEGAKQAQATINSMSQSSYWGPLKTPIMRLYVVGQEYFLNTPPAHLAPVGLIGVMGTVFLAWKVKRWEPFMRKWWLHRPVILGSGAVRQWQNSVTLFTSTLSHQSLPHYAFNSFALYSFGAAAYSFIATPPPSTEPTIPSSTHTPHFLAFLLVAGLASSLSSHLWTNLVRLPKLIRTLSSPARISSAQALAAHQAILPSLGASGAIYAALTVTACAFPDSHVGIIFVPFISFPIGLGVAGMVGIDLLGLIRGWRMFDHVAHLSGALFGFIYYQYGRQAWAWTRRLVGSQGPREVVE